MSVKAQTEVRRALNAAKMATKGRNVTKRSLSASFARPGRISARRSTILVRETAPATGRLWLWREASVIGNDPCSPREHASYQFSWRLVGADCP